MQPCGRLSSGKSHVGHYLTPILLSSTGRCAEETSSWVRGRLVNYPDESHFPIPMKRCTARPHTSRRHHTYPRNAKLSYQSQDTLPYSHFLSEGERTTRWLTSHPGVLVGPKYDYKGKWKTYVRWKRRYIGLSISHRVSKTKRSAENGTNPPIKHA